MIELAHNGFDDPVWLCKTGLRNPLMEMNLDRRNFLGLSIGGTLAATAIPTLSFAQTEAVAPTLPVRLTERGSVLPTRGNITGASLPTNGGNHGMRYMTPGRFGMGGTQIGNIFAPISDADAHDILQAAWDAGVRYFDTSPFYGFGLSEYRLGRFLHTKNPDDYVISTKVGRILTAAGKPVGDKAIWTSPAPFNYAYDYTAAGARRSVEDSLQRLGLPRIDIVYIHDLSPDNSELPGSWEDVYKVAAPGAMSELSKMRDEGLIKAWGFGINTPNAAVRATELDGPVPDIVLLACQYTIIDHDEALTKTFPALQKKGTSVVVGTPLNDGFLGGRSRFNFSADLPKGVAEKRAKLMAVADRFGLDIRTAALQFAAAHPIVSAIIPGARAPRQVAANVQSMKVAIPEEFWQALRSEKLIADSAPTAS
ncbi:aldo/keto reductase [Agrobacterium sp. MCAB5]|uniref:aldo/keto reductase n=1 Tax=Agrobacterium sp. MCAB5 TaxID=3233042 RepID=UPI003F92B880